MERKILYRCLSGSKLYGTNTPTSDDDFVSVLMPLPKDVLGLQKMEQTDASTKASSENRRNTKDDVDDHQYALNYYLHLVINGNPNLTEILFAPEASILATSPEFEELRENKLKLISNRVYHSFSGFAYSQMQKLLVKKERFVSLGEATKFLEEMYPRIVEPFYPVEYSMTEDVANVLNKIVKHYKGSKNDIQSFHKGLSTKIVYQKIKSEYENYGWRVKTDTFETLGYDTKFASHAIRLFAEAEELLKTGSIKYPLEKADLIKDVKNGKFEVDKLIEIYENMKREADKAYERSVLIDKPDFNFANDWITKTLLVEFSKYI